MGKQGQHIDIGCGLLAIPIRLRTRPLLAAKQGDLSDMAFAVMSEALKKLIHGLSAHDPLPKPELLWEKDGSQEIGEDEPEKIWLSAGRALSAFETLEEQLAEFFSFFVESKSRAAVKAYGAVTGGRNNLLAEAANAFFERHNGYLCDVEEFKMLQRHHGLAASFRNEVAHGVVKKFMNDSDQKDAKWLLVSPSYNTRKVARSTDYRYYTYKLSEVGSKYLYASRQIDDFYFKCLILNKRFHYFYMEIAQVYDHDVITGFKKVPEVFIRPDKRRLNDSRDLPVDDGGK